LSENERKVPIRLKQAEALRNRLPTHHKRIPEIESEIARRRAGFRGEQNLDYHLSFLPDSNSYAIFKDLNLKDRHTFQIDTLLISPYYALIIEVKNYSGILHIDPHTKQLIRKKGQNVDGFPNPILQAIRHQKQLKNWLQKEKFESYPVEYLVAFHEGNSIFKSDQMDKRLFNRLIFADNIHNKLNQFERIHQTIGLDENRIRKLKKRIMNQNKPTLPDILKKYDISVLELVSGVQCPVCSTFGMKRISGSWKCVNCNSTSKTAYVKAIEEFLLLNHSITNKQCRYFLHLTSSNTAYRLLKDLQHPSFGENKHREYYLQL
jgi:hypothetical protein